MNLKRSFKSSLFIILAFVLALSPLSNLPALAAESSAGLERIGEEVDSSKPVTEELVLAVIGDYGGCGVGNCEGQQKVADMVHSWNPDYIVTTGDNTYQRGLQEEVERAQKSYEKDIEAGIFFPIMGNHDYGNGCNAESIQPSIDKFGVPVAYVAGFGNGLVDFVNPDANCNKSSGDKMPPIYDAFKNTVDNSQADWVIVGEHQPVFSSGKAGNNHDRSWVITPGVDLILAGHDHHAEHIQTKDGDNIVISGNGGNGTTPIFSPVDGSLFRDDKNLGAVRLIVTPETLKVEYRTLSGEDEYNFTLKKDETGKAYLADRMDWVDPNPDFGQVPAPNAYSVSMDVDESTAFDGLSYESYQDGPAKEINVDGKNVVQLEKNPFGGGNHLYLLVDDEYIHGGPYHVEATIKYRSPVAGAFSLQYDSANSGSAYQKSEEVKITSEDIDQWQTAKIDLPDARFTNRQNGGADMRLMAGNNLPLLIESITFEVVKDGPLVDHVSMDFLDEPNGLDWIPYESGPAHEMTIDGRTALQVDKNPFNQGNNLYLSVDDRFIYGGPYNMRATIEYRSPVAGTFTLQYESAETGAAYQAAEKVTIKEEDINQWQTAVVDLPQAMFTNRQNGGADFRIVGAKNLPLIIGSMKLDSVKEESDESYQHAEEAVVVAENLANQALDTQAKIDAATDAANQAKALVEELQDSEKGNLVDRLHAVSTKIDEAQEKLEQTPEPIVPAKTYDFKKYKTGKLMIHKPSVSISLDADSEIKNGVVFTGEYAEFHGKGFLNTSVTIKPKHDGKTVIDFKGIKVKEVIIQGSNVDILGDENVTYAK